MTTNLLDVQEALQAKGFDPGPLDGVRGRKTIAAILAFQSAAGLCCITSREHNRAFT